MERRTFIKSLVAGSAATGALSGEAVSSQGSQATRPNFLFMIADDLTYRAIRTLYDEEVHTPNLDRLAARGCAFTHCFQQGSWTPAVCIASRMMLVTGLNTFRANQDRDFTPLWGQTLRNAGYQTYIVGKWHLDPTMLQRCFDEMGPVGPGMYESGPEAYRRPRSGDPWIPWNRSLKGHWLHTKLWIHARKDEIRHSCQIYTDSAVDYLTNKVPRLAEPFFMYIGFNSPHDPRQSPKEFVDMFPRDKIDIPPNFLPEFPFDNGFLRGRDEQLAPFPRTHAAVQLHRSEYYAIIAHLDGQIGRILDALERSGKADNTYVIFTADHGLAVGQHGLMRKQSLFDHSIRMPWLIRGPGVPEGKRVDDLVYQHCTFATTCELAGIPIPSSVEFPSIAGLIKGQGTPKYDAVFSRYLDYQRTVRTKDYKLIVYPKVNKVELFDLNKNPWELLSGDLAENTAMTAVRNDLIQRLHSFQEQLGDPLVVGKPKPIWES